MYPSMDVRLLATPAALKQPGPTDEDAPEEQQDYTPVAQNVCLVQDIQERPDNEGAEAPVANTTSRAAAIEAELVHLKEKSKGLKAELAGLRATELAALNSTLRAYEVMCSPMSSS